MDNSNRELDEQITGLQVLRKEVVDNGGVLTVRMSKLMDAYKVSDLNGKTTEGLIAALAGHGLRYRRSSERNVSEVRLYIAGTRIADVIEAVHETGQKGDAILRQINEDVDSKTLLNRIRALVADPIT